MAAGRSGGQSDKARLHPHHHSVLTAMLKQRQSGSAFTLIELLIAAGITAVIVVMLGIMFGSLTKTSSRANQRIDAFRDARAALQMISRDLAGLVRNQRDASGNPITRPAAYLVLDNIYTDPASGNQQIFALVAAKNSGPGDLCAVGYYCRWDDKGGYNYSLRRFFRDSTATFSALSSVATYASQSVLYVPDPVPTTPPLKDDLLAAYVWNLQITAYDKSGVIINPQTTNGVTTTKSPYVCDPDAATNNPLPATLEISFKAISSDAARAVIATTTGRADAYKVWMANNDPTASPSDQQLYQRLIGPHAYEFRSRIKL
jgi:type II secretory pathway pseudopilin PulG